MGIHAARETGEETRQREHANAVAERVDTEGLTQVFVLIQRIEHGAGRRAKNAKRDKVM